MVKKIIAGLTGSLLLAISVPMAALAATMVVVTPTNHQGWTFNPDPINATPYEFSDDEASIGEGSLYVLPISAVPTKKFIAAKQLNIVSSDFNSISYDFLIAGSSISTSYKHFYTNVYANLPNSNTYFDCRFDYVPTTGSTTEFTTLQFSNTTTATSVGDIPSDGFNCPTTISEMPSGSTVSFFSLNVGDTSINDAGLAGYLDKVVVNTTKGTTVYNFEPTVRVANKEACKNGGWQNSNTPVFKNQGGCVSYFASNKKQN